MDRYNRHMLENLIETSRPVILDEQVNLILTKSKKDGNNNDITNIMNENKGDEVEEIVINLRRIFRML